jgi:flagellar basal body-associated protein FliL
MVDTCKSNSSEQKWPNDCPRIIIIIIIIIITIIIIIIIILVITFMQGTYNYIPETNHVSGYIL